MHQNTPMRKFFRDESMSADIISIAVKTLVQFF